MPKPFETTLAGLVVRPATRADAPVLLAFIRELAEFEQLLDRVTATIAGLEHTLFGPKPYAEVIVAEREGTVVGSAIFFHNYSTFRAAPGLYLEDLYVTPSARGHGIGRTLMTVLARIALERGCARFDWQVLDWNERALAFYRSLGAEPLSEWTTQRLAGAALERLANGP